MKKSFRLFIVAVAIMGVGWPHFATATQPPLVGDGGATAESFVQDVALNPGNTLAIQVVDAQGKPHLGTPIAIRTAGNTVHHCTTGKDGQVVVSQLKPGVYQVTSGSRGGIYRLWAPQTAPPRVSNGILLIDEGGVVRGSRGGWQKAAVVGGVIITSAVLGGVIGYNLKDAS